MKMKRMQKKQFLSYVLDERKHKVAQQHPFEVFFYNPLDVRGKPSSFVYVVLLGAHKDEIYCAGSKYNPLDGVNPSGRNFQPFDLGEGLNQACNRVWREFNNMPSLYGKDHGPKQPTASRILKTLRVRISQIAASAVPPIHAFPSPFRPHMSKRLAEARRKLIAAISEEEHDSKKSTH
jgi:hypothetical protein